MKTLITGGAGFIGSHVAECLVKSGEKVTVLDDLSTGRFENLSPISSTPGFTFVHGCAADVRLTSRLIRSVDRVIHLAAEVGVARIHERRSQSIDNAVAMNQVVISESARRGRPLVYASSSEIYGPKADSPIAEDSPVLLGPTTCHRWSYAAAKALGEWSALAHHQERGHPLSIVRLFNTVGPRQVSHHGMVLPRFIENALLGKDLEVHGDGLQSRSFSHVRETARALAEIAQSTTAGSRILNLGSAEETRILDLAKRVIETTASSSKVVFVDPKVAFGASFEDVEHRRPNLEALQAALGWTPSGSIETIIADLVEDRRSAHASESL